MKTQRNTVRRILGALLACTILASTLCFVGCKRTQQLENPTQLTVQNGVLYWNEVPDASEYIVRVDTAEHTTQSTQWALRGFEQPGRYTLSVRALASQDGILASNWSEPVVITRLHAPLISQSGTDALHWNAVDKSVGYEIFHGDVSIAVVDASFTSYTIAEPVVGDEYSIAALGDENYILSSVRSAVLTLAESEEEATAPSQPPSKPSSTPRPLPSADVPVTPTLATPSGLSFDVATSTLSWNAVPDAESYRVTVDGGTPQSVNATSLVITGLIPGSHSFGVQAVTTVSGISNSAVNTLPYTMNKWDLGTLQNVRIELGCLVWSALPNASSYSIKILDSSSVEVHSISVSTSGTLKVDLYSYNLAFGNYTVSLQALGNSSYNHSAIVTRDYTEKMLRDVTASVKINYNYADASLYWISAFLDFSLKQSLTLDVPDASLLSGAPAYPALTATYYTYMTAPSGSAQKTDAARLIGSDIIVTYYYVVEGVGNVPLSTTNPPNPLAKNKLWDDWLWPAPYSAALGGTMGVGTVGAIVPAATAIRVASNIMTPSGNPVASVYSSYDLPALQGRTLYIQLDVIYKYADNSVSIYTETASVAIQAFPD